MRTGLIEGSPSEVKELEIYWPLDCYDITIPWDKTG